MINEKISQSNTQADSDVQWSEPTQGLARLISKRKQRFETELKSSPPEPPWKKHPGHPRSDQFWRTGIGSQYLMEYIWPYNRYSTKEARQLYRQTYPEPENWAGWYSE